MVLRGVADAAVAEAGGAESVVKRAFAAVAEGGFLNYFGLQRFGTREIRTHAVGAALLAGRWDQAVRLILGDTAAMDGGRVAPKRPAEAMAAGDQAVEPPLKVARVEAAAEAPPAGQEESSEADRKPLRQVAEEAAQVYLAGGDAQKALQAMPRSQHLERCILGALARQLPPLETLRQMPHQAASLYVHAAQSAVWNACLSRRIREHGKTPVRYNIL